MSINEETVKHVAKLAKLEFQEETIHGFTKELDQIIQMVEQLEDLDTTGVEGTYHGITHHSVLRKDEAKKEFERDDLFANVKTKQDGFIKVPAIMDNGESGA
ncbi:Asp-tRNA(Asn)/Glu-tRNA(Gln) amidotransferase subunit GatC [Marinilactibacillus piezotolerans]|uniref:Asp-tRNA(Asn)/Glu-tRNA(Gln) amidotransferase subunit GatC n=1 Tax=Marinilactibacillus piezotolerans TaxID=258723 RepID=UPI0009B15A17|nr:Asp-tRNA(Asn)/Glu-tRNA(Gln) amidotransferase subunit GatC [Marinilactibacillus piezotolerans]